MYAWGEADFFSPNVMVSEGLGMALSGTEYSQNDLEACQRLGREGFLEIIIPAIGEIASVGTVYVEGELF